MREDAYSLAPPEVVNQPKVWLIALPLFRKSFVKIEQFNVFEYYIENNNNTKPAYICVCDHDQPYALSFGDQIYTLKQQAHLFIDGDDVYLSLFEVTHIYIHLEFCGHFNVMSASFNHSSIYSFIQS